MTAARRVRLSGLIWLLVTPVVGAASAAPVPISRAVDWVATGVEVVGVAIIVLGAMLATAVFLIHIGNFGGVCSGSSETPMA
jgi:hypothetical protein